MATIVSQILGGIVFVLVFVSMQSGRMERVLLCQIGCNGLGMLSYVLLGGFSGCGIYLVATLQSGIFFFLRKSNREAPKWLNPVIVAAYLACSALSLKGWLDLVPMAAAVLCALGISQKKASNYRIVMLLNGAVWIVYDLFIGAYTMLASHVITVGSALLGILRLDLFKKKEKTKSEESV